MGERNNILLENDGIYLYSHGDTKRELMEVVKSALRRSKERWNDRPYLNRIIFSELIIEDVMGLTGFGLSSDESGGNTVIKVNVEEQTVNGIDFEKVIKDV